MPAKWRSTQKATSQKCAAPTNAGTQTLQRFNHVEDWIPAFAQRKSRWGAGVTTFEGCESGAKQVSHRPTHHSSHRLAHGDEFLRRRRVNADGGVKLRLGRATIECHRKALDDFASIGADHMHAEYAITGRIDN